MPAAAAVPLMVGGGVLAANALGGMMGADAARDAARIQSRSADKGVALQRDIYNQNRQDQLPWMQAGQQSLATLSGMVQGGGFGNYQGQYQDPGAFVPGQFQFDPNQDPGAKYRIEEANRGLERSAAAKGGLLSGNTIKSVAELNQNLASQEYGAAFDRFMQSENMRGNATNANRAFSRGVYESERSNFNGDRAFQYGTLADLSGVGRQTAGALGQQGQQFGSSLADLFMQSGNAQASGRVGQANAATGAINNSVNTLATLYGAGMFG